MNEIVDLLLCHKLIFKKLKKIENKTLGTRKKIEIYVGVDLHSNYTGIFELRQKSRFLRKNADDLETLYEKLKIVQEHNFKRKILLFDMPLCSKAHSLMKERKWKLIDVSV